MVDATLLQEQAYLGSDMPKFWGVSPYYVRMRCAFHFIQLFTYNN